MHSSNLSWRYGCSQWCSSLCDFTFWDVVCVLFRGWFSYSLEGSLFEVCSTQEIYLYRTEGFKKNSGIEWQRDHYKNNHSLTHCRLMTNSNLVISCLIVHWLLFKKKYNDLALRRCDDLWTVFPFCYCLLLALPFLRHPGFQPLVWRYITTPLMDLISSYRDSKTSGKSWGNLVR